MKRVFVKIFLILFVAVACTGGGKQLSKDLEEAVYHFYMGQSQTEQGNYYEAMDEFLKAEQLSKDSDRDVLKGQICWNKGLLYAQKMDYTSALEMYVKAAEFFSAKEESNQKLSFERREVDVREPLMFTYEQMAKVYAVNGNSEKAIYYYKEAEKLGVELRAKMLFSPHDSTVTHKEGAYNEALMRFSTAIAAQYALQPGGEDKALAQLDSIYSLYNGGAVKPTDYPLLAKIYLQKGDVAKAREALQGYKKYNKNSDSVNPDNLLEHYKIAGAVAKASGDYKEATAYLDKYILLEDSLSRVAKSESVREAEQQFWQRQLEEENYRIRERNNFMILVYSVLVVLLGGGLALILWIYREKIKRKNVQLAQYADAVDSLGTRVTQLDEHKAKEKELKDLLENRFAEVRELARTYYEFGDSKKLQKKVDDILKMQLSGDNFEVMEQVVNAKNNDIIKKVRERYPKMKEDNIKLLNLIYAGFSAQEISVILNDTPQNIYVRKSRLKKSIKDLILEDTLFNFN